MDHIPYSTLVSSDKTPVLSQVDWAAVFPGSTYGCSSVWCGWVFQCLVWMGVPVSGALISAHSPNTRKYCPLDAEGPSFLLGWAWQRDVRKMEATLLPISLDGLSCIHKTMYQLCNQ